MAKTIHGKSRSNEYHSWINMKARCYRKTHPRYEEWGGKGIEVCDRWKNSFSNFIEDMGCRPKGMTSIDRINSKGNYCKENCRWANGKIQSNNREDFVRKIFYKNKQYNLTQLSEKFKVNREMLKYRLDNNWSIHDAINIPSRKYKVYAKKQLYR